MEQMSGPGTVTVRQRPRWTIPAGAGVVVFALGLAVSLAAQPTMSGKISAAVFFGLFIAVIVWFWLRANRWRDRIEITPDAITFRHGRRGGPSIMLTREQGTDLRLIPALRDHGIPVGPRLTLVGSDQDITIYGFSANAVRRGCTAVGWQFGNGTPEEAARTLRDLDLPTSPGRPMTNRSVACHYGANGSGRTHGRSRGQCGTRNSAGRRTRSRGAPPPDGESEHRPGRRPSR
jgi:hypothetical protein